MIKDFLKRIINKAKRRAFAAIMAAVLLGVSVPIPAYADVSIPDDYEINFVVIPEGFGLLGSTEGFHAYSSKVMIPVSVINSSGFHLNLSYKKNANLIDRGAVKDVFVNGNIENYIYGTRSEAAKINGVDMFVQQYRDKESSSNITLSKYLREKYSEDDIRRGYSTIVFMLEPETINSSTNFSSTTGSNTSDTTGTNTTNDKTTTINNHTSGSNTSSSAGGSTQYVYDPSRAITSAVITLPYPNAGGTTSGDVQGYSTLDTTITANPNPGYVFDHWEKNGEDIGGTRSMNVTAAGSMDVYAAVFKPDTLAYGVIAQTKAEGGIPNNLASGTKYYQGEETTTTIRAQEITKGSSDTDWYFDYWQNSEGSIVSFSREYTVPVRKSRDLYYACYTPYPRGVFVETESKDTQGNTAGHASGGGLRRVNGVVQHTYTLTAVPEEGYSFDHWEEKCIDYKNGEEILIYDWEETAGGPSVTVNTTDRHDEYRAVFVSKENFTKGVRVDVAPDADGNKHGKVTGDKAYEGSNTSTLIRAIPDSDTFVFDYWSVVIGSESSAERVVSYLPEYTAPVTESVDKYYAHFTNHPAGVYIYPDVENGSASGGGPRRVNGTIQYSYTLKAEPNEGYVFDHWEKRRWDGTVYTDWNTVAGGATVTVNTSNNNYREEYNPIFKRKEDITKGVRVEVASGSEGRGVAIGSKAYEGNDTTTIIKAKADTENGWYFDHWGAVLGSGSTAEFVISYSEEYTVEVTDSCDVYYAYFAESQAGTFPKSASPSQGTVAGGSAYIVNGQKVYETTLYAYPKPGYVFKGWTLASGSEASGSVATDSIVYKDSPFVVDVTEERIIYIANFKLKNSITNEDVDFVGHATGIINKLDVLADRYFNEGAFSADRSTVESKAAEAMARTDYLRIAPYASASAMINALQEELKIPVRKSANSIGDLGTDLVSSDGEIIPLKKQTVDDSITAAADETVEDKYGSLYKATVIMAVEPLLPADFADGKRTLLWSDTGVDKKDRLIIIQQIPGMDDEILTPIADNKGRAKFSAARLGGSRLILVKVEYK